MVFLLYAVSLLLTLGGGAAALFGADTIRTETGATLAVAGVAMTCAGLLMFALTACLSELKKIRRLVESGEAVQVGGPVPLPASPAPLVPAVTAAAVAAAVVAADRTPVDTAVRAEDPEKPAETGSEPEPEPEPDSVPMPAVALPPVEAAMKPDEPTPEPPMATPAVPSAESAAGTGEWDPERPAHVPAAPSPVESGPASDVASTTEPGSHVEPAVTEPAPEAPPASLPTLEERELVATYTSGENTYFMYSDNAIEAETPLGRFRFGSMEELRVFVETGTGGMPLSPPPPRV